MVVSSLFIYICVETLIMEKRSTLLLTFILISLTHLVMGQTNCDSLLFGNSIETSMNQWLPKTENELQIIDHKAYTLGYFEKHEQAAWVCYVLSKEECIGEEERSSSFYQDKRITTGSATNSDYKKSGYDRGHLAPAGDMSYDSTAMKESFYYSNMSPQVPAFNRGIWKKLETQVREWSVLYGSCIVITGPILSDSLLTIGLNQVSVPNWYYKIILNPHQTPIQAIGFLMRNESSSAELSEFVVTVDSIEVISGIDFFSELPLHCEQIIESSVDGRYWKGFDSICISCPISLPSSRKRQ